MRQIISLRKRLLKIPTQIVPVQGAYFVSWHSHLFSAGSWPSGKNTVYLLVDPLASGSCAVSICASSILLVLGFCTDMLLSLLCIEVGYSTVAFDGRVNLYPHQSDRMGIYQSLLYVTQGQMEPLSPERSVVQAPEFALMGRH